MKLLNNTILTLFVAIISFCTFPVLREIGPIVGLILLKYVVFKADTESKSLFALIVDMFFWFLFVVFSICDILLNAMLYLWTTKL